MEFLIDGRTQRNYAGRHLASGDNDSVSLSRPQRGIGAALAAVIIWALVPVGTRFFVLRVDPFLFNIIRFIASGTAAIPLFVRARPWRWPAADRRLLLWCAMLAIPGYNIPVALGAQTVPAVRLGLLIATEPVFIVVLTLVLKRQPIGWRVWIGSALALAGVALTSRGEVSPHGFSWFSTLQVVGGAASWSCYTVLVSRLNQRYGAFGVTGGIVVVGTVVLLAISVPMIPASAMPDPMTTSLLAGMGLASSLLGFVLWSYAGARVPAERMGLVLYLIPIVCVLAGAGFLGEPLTGQIVAGGALTVFGVWVASRVAKGVANEAGGVGGVGLANEANDANESAG
jgi:drug/metabolite transporter (DMT)-like permease